MSTYAVYLDEPNEGVWDTVKAKWPGRHYILDDRMAFVAPAGITTSAQVSEAVGICEDQQLLGVVIDCSRYSGFNRHDLWEWLDKARAA